MATHNIDIAIDTGKTKTDLDRVNDSLQKMEVSTIAAAKANITLESSNLSMAKAQYKTSVENVKNIENEVKALEKLRDRQLARERDIQAARRDARNQYDQSDLNDKYIALTEKGVAVNRDYEDGVRKLAAAQAELAVISNDIAQIETRRQSSIQTITREQQAQRDAIKQAEQAQRQQATATANAKRSNDQLVQSMRNQLEITKRGGVEGKIYQNQLKLNSQATKEQRQEVERLTRELDKMNSKQSSGGGSGLSVGRLAAGAGLVFGAAQILQWGKDALDTASKMEELQVRVRATTKTQEEANVVFGQLVNVANTMGTSIESAAGAYARFARFAERLGASQGDVVQFIDTLNKLGQVGGASAQEVDSAIYQLSQSFAAGKLQGQEFSIVAKSMPNVLDELARVMGVTRGELNKLSSEGKITAQDLLKLKDGSAELDAKFAALPRSIGQASEALKNNMSVAIDIINNKLEITKTLALWIDNFANQVILNAADYGAIEKQTALQSEILKYDRDIAEARKEGAAWYDSDATHAAKIAQMERERGRLIGEQVTLREKLRKQQEEAANRPAYVQPDDPEASREIQKLKDKIELEKLSGEAKAKLKAIQNLGSAATKEQRDEAEKLAAQLYNLEQQTKNNTKAEKDANREKLRSAKELEKHRKANQKYIDELTATTEKHKNELDTAKSMIGTNLTLGKSVDDLVFQYKNLTEIKFQNNLLSSQAESLAKLNNDRTDEQVEKVKQLTEALERQKIAKELAQQVSTIQGDLQSELGDPFELELAKINDQEAQRLAVLDQWRAVDKDNAEMYEQMKLDAMRSAAEQREQVTLSETKSTLNASANMLGGFSQLISQFQSDSDNKNKLVFAAAKAFAIASAGLNFSSALMQVLADPSALTLPQKLANYALVASSGAALIGQIRSQNFADGGYVSGRGTGRSDEIPALLSNGEYVATSKATQRYRPQLEAMNRGTYSEDGGSRPVNIEIINTTGARVTTQQLTEDDVRVIIGEEVPELVGAQMQDPYSPLFRATQSSFKVERNV